jgi:hypothetical protein
MICGQDGPMSMKNKAKRSKELQIDPMAWPGGLGTGARHGPSRRPAGLLVAYFILLEPF